MSTRFRIALAFATLLAFVRTVPVLAKGNFAFIVVSGGSLTSDVRLSSASLTTYWFAFADFQSGGVPTPANAPQDGYVITRYYIDGGRKSAFDQLHYYPAAGLVYYDGIVGGSSEYDRKWYAARPEVRAAFEQEVLVASMQEALRHMPFIRKS